MKSHWFPFIREKKKPCESEWGYGYAQRDIGIGSPVIVGVSHLLANLGTKLSTHQIIKAHVGNPSAFLFTGIVE